MDPAGPAEPDATYGGEPAMTRSRREFIRIGSAAATYSALAVPAAVMADDPALGLIFPPLNYPIPPDAERLYPTGVRFLSGGVGLPGGMTVEGYDEAVPRICLRLRHLRNRERRQSRSSDRR